ncbi:hypothetical protein [Duck adenovirus 1]|uniref:Uncharacterized protein n=1 Tax=Duck adenovirus 1 TaxID=130329 RepID=A0A0D3MVW9_DADV1|nr:hypothetical protein [Duck adenovirus 1]AJA72375.1 hypothetical protein [Duck adenovirus 1]
MSARLNKYECLLQLVLQYRSKGLLCYLQKVKCGCKKELILPRVALRIGTQTEFICFAEKRPCCAWIITDIMEIAEMINTGFMNFIEVPLLQEGFAAVSYLYFYCHFIYTFYMGSHILYSLSDIGS